MSQGKEPIAASHAPSPALVGGGGRAVLCAVIALLALCLSGCGLQSGTSVDAFQDAADGVGGMTMTLDADDCGDIVSPDDLGAGNVSVSACAVTYASSLAAVYIEADGEIPSGVLDEVKSEMSSEGMSYTEAGDSGIEVDWHDEWLGIYLSSNAILVVVATSGDSDAGHAFAQDAGFLDGGLLPGGRRTRAVLIVAVLVIVALAIILTVGRSRKKAQVDAAFAGAPGPYPADAYPTAPYPADQYPAGYGDVYPQDAYPQGQAAPDDYGYGQQAYAPQPYAQPAQAPGYPTGQWQDYQPDPSQGYAPPQQDYGQYDPYAAPQPDPGRYDGQSPQPGQDRQNPYAPYGYDPYGSYGQ